MAPCISLVASLASPLGRPRGQNRTAPLERTTAATRRTSRSWLWEKLKRSGKPFHDVTDITDCWERRHSARRQSVPGTRGRRRPLRRPRPLRCPQSSSVIPATLSHGQTLLGVGLARLFPQNRRQEKRLQKDLGAEASQDTREHSAHRGAPCIERRSAQVLANSSPRASKSKSHCVVATDGFDPPTS